MIRIIQAIMCYAVSHLVMHVCIRHCGHGPDLIFVTSILHACSVDIETNPRPNLRRSNQGQYFIFCHAMKSIKNFRDKFDHIKVDFRGVYDAITKIDVDMYR